MNENDYEKDGVEVRNDRSGTDASTPRKAHSPVCNIVGLAGVCPPTTRQ